MSTSTASKFSKKKSGTPGITMPGTQSALKKKQEAKKGVQDAK